MKIERIYSGAKVIIHLTSSGIKETDLKNKKVINKERAQEILAYVENYVNKNGFERVEITSEGNDVSYFLIKK